MIVLHWADLKQLDSTLDPAGLCLRDMKTKEKLAFQILDKEQNGMPEEVIFPTNLKAGETKQFIFEVVSNKVLNYTPPLTYAGYMIPREDIAWENDRIAYRIYGPAFVNKLNNGIDVWTKRVSYPIVEKWYRLDEAEGVKRIPYHEDHGEGADFFDVGRSLGAGSCALYKGDSLFQPGVFETYKILATGPFRAMFEVTYKPVQLNGVNISEKKKITLDAGSNLNKVEVTYACSSSKGEVTFASGLVKRKGVAIYSDLENHWISLWGLTNEQEENGSLGTGIIMPKEIFNGIKEDGVHVLLLGTAELGIPWTYYAGAGWTRRGDFNTAEEWNKYLREFARRIDSPCRITLARE
jgi:pectinesterase